MKEMPSSAADRTMAAYYNEIDPFCADWLRNLISAGLIAPGDVDERDIRDVVPTDLTGYEQCHFFAGIGGWSLALRLSGWPDERPVWTGSCPCQPFSMAGSQRGFADERHLWPAWHWLITQRRPGVVFGEQVESPDGQAWLDLISTDLEALGYACGAVIIPAAGVGAPHLRHRIWFVADANCNGCTERGIHEFPGTLDCSPKSASQEQSTASSTAPADCGATGGGLGDAAGEQMGVPGLPWESRATNGFWRDVEWIACLDGKARPIKSRSEPLALGVPARVGRLRAYGNAIVPQVAAEVIRAWMEIER